MNPEMSYTSSTDDITQKPTPQSFINRLIGVYFSPGETFAEIGRAPRVILPIIVLALLTVLATYVTFSRIPMDRVMEQRVTEAVDSGRITPEQAEQQREGMRKMAPYMKMFFPVIALISIIIITLVIAGIAKLASLMMGVENNFMPIWSVAIYATLAVAIISSILFLILLFIKPADEFDLNNPLGSNLTALLSVMGVELPKFLKALLTYVDIFFIWKIILLGIGFSAVSRKLKTSTAITTTAIVAVVFALVGAAWTSTFG